MFIAPCVKRHGAPSERDVWRAESYKHGAPSEHGVGGRELNMLLLAGAEAL